MNIQQHAELYNVLVALRNTLKEHTLRTHNEHHMRTLTLAHGACKGLIETVARHIKACLREKAQAHAPLNFTLEERNTLAMLVSIAGVGEMLEECEAVQYLLSDTGLVFKN